MTRSAWCSFMSPTVRHYACKAEECANDAAESSPIAGKRVSLKSDGVFRGRKPKQRHDAQKQVHVPTNLGGLEKCINTYYNKAGTKLQEPGVATVF